MEKPCSASIKRPHCKVCRGIQRSRLASTLGLESLDLHQINQGHILNIERLCIITHKSATGLPVKTPPTVSIITPCFNAEATLEKTVASVLAQSYSDWELILIDDHSTDATYTHVKRYAEKDPRIKAVRMETNGGAAKARNRGIEMAQGRYIAFIDADDLWHTDKLKTQISLMESNNWALSFTSYKRIDGGGKSLNNVGVPLKANYKKLLKTNYIGLSLIHI